MFSLSCTYCVAVLTIIGSSCENLVLHEHNHQYQDQIQLAVEGFVVVVVVLVFVSKDIRHVVTLVRVRLTN